MRFTIRQESIKHAKAYAKSKRVSLQRDLSILEPEEVLEKHWTSIRKMDALGDRRYGFITRSALRAVIDALLAA